MLLWCLFIICSLLTVRAEDVKTNLIFVRVIVHWMFHISMIPMIYGQTRHLGTEQNDYYRKIVGKKA